METMVDLVGHSCRDCCVALDKISFGFKLRHYPFLFQLAHRTFVCDNSAAGASE
jgi:hypothetical protein